MTKGADGGGAPVGGNPSFVGPPAPQSQGFFANLGGNVMHALDDPQFNRYLRTVGSSLLAQSGWSTQPVSLSEMLGKSMLAGQQDADNQAAAASRGRLNDLQMREAVSKLNQGGESANFKQPDGTVFSARRGTPQYDAAVEAGLPMSGVVDATTNAQPGFELSPGQTRFDAKGQPIASLPAAPANSTPTTDAQNYERAKSDPGFAAYLASKTPTPKPGFTPEMDALLGAMNSRGVSLPQGFRAQAQQIATLRGLLAKYPDKSPDEITDVVAKGQVDWGAIKKETQTAATVAGRVSVAANELQQMAPIVLEVSSRVGREKFVPYNKLKLMSQESLSDPDLVQLKVGLNSMLNAYDLLAARGGTDQAKREEAHKLIESAQSPEALAAGVKMFQIEAGAALRAAEDATAYHSPDASTDASPTGSAPIAAPTYQEGQTGTNPKTGEKWIYRDGQWQKQ